MPNEGLLYEESETMPRWIPAAVSVMFIAAIAASVLQTLNAAEAGADVTPLKLGTGFIVVVGIFVVGLLFRAHMLIRLEPTLLHLRIAPIGRHRDFPLSELTGEMEIRDHHPWDRFHHKTIKGGRYAFSAKRIVQVHLANGGWLLIGSHQPEALLAAIKQARAGAGASQNAMASGAGSR